jgi:hypothetical protein
LFAILLASIVLILIKVSLLASKNNQNGEYSINGRSDKVSPRQVELELNNTVQVEEYEESPIIKNILNYLKLHLLVEIFKENAMLYKLSHIINLFTSMYLGYALIGAILYSQIDIDNRAEDSLTDISEEHYPEDFKHIFIVLGIIIPVSLPLRFVIKIDKRRVIIPVLMVTLVVMVGSLLGVLLMGRYFCETATLRWTLAYLIFIPLELSISEFIIALVLFIAGRR